MLSLTAHRVVGDVVCHTNMDLDTNSFWQLNVRVPSMLIVRDQLKNSSYNLPVGIAVGNIPCCTTSPSPGVLVADGTMPSRVLSIPIPQISVSGIMGTSAEAFQKQETLHRKFVQRQMEELMMNAVEKTSKVDDWTVKQWLQL